MKRRCDHGQHTHFLNAPLGMIEDQTEIILPPIPKAMSLEQLYALIERLKQDKLLMEKLRSARNIDEAESIAKDAGFKVRKADWLKYQAQQTLELSPEELESISGGGRARYVASQGIRGYCALEKAVNHGGLKGWAKQKGDPSKPTTDASTSETPIK